MSAFRTLLAILGDWRYSFTAIVFVLGIVVVVLPNFGGPRCNSSKRFNEIEVTASEH